MKRQCCVTLGFFAGVCAGFSPAHAAPIPKPVAEMIIAAGGSDNIGALEATAALARKTNPLSVKEIDALATSLRKGIDQRRHAKLRRQSFLHGWKGQGQAGASNTSGNIRSTLVSVGVGLGREGLSWKHKFDAAVDYQRDNGVANKDRYFASWKSDHKFNERFYTLGLVSWESDRFSGFSSRLSESLGVGCAIFDGPDMKLSIEGGPAMRQTDYLASPREQNLSGRAAANYQWKIGGRLVITEGASYYKESRDSTFTSETAVTVNLMGALSARTSFLVQYESNPQPLLAQTNTTSRVSLVYSF